MKGLALPASVLARQSPAVRAQLAAAGKRRAPSKPAAPITAAVTREGDVATIMLRGLAMPSLANMNWYPAHRAKERQSAALLPVLAGIKRPPLPWRVTITRIAPRPLDPGGNLYTSAKRCQDDLARWAGVNDRDDKVVAYTVTQETGPVACRITIAPMNPPTLADVPVPEV